MPLFHDNSKGKSLKDFKTKVILGPQIPGGVKCQGVAGVEGQTFLLPFSFLLCGVRIKRIVGANGSVTAKGKERMCSLFLVRCKDRHCDHDIQKGSLDHRQHFHLTAFFSESDFCKSIPYW
jgi:hypothetical protein